MRYARLALLALTAAAVPVVTATPAHALTTLASCGGTAPLVTSCSTTGTMPSSTSSQFIVGCTGAHAGVIHMEVTTSTGSISQDCIPFGEVAYYRLNYVQTGTIYVSQTFTLTGQTSGAGLWNVEVAQV